MTWPVGISVTSWDYMWRTTPLHRREVHEADAPAHHPPPLPAGASREEVQPPASGRGPLFHRTYRTSMREAGLSPEQVMARVKGDVNAAAPSFARFQRVLGEGDSLAVGDEYVVRMPGPWDGPVRVIDETDRSFRLATLDGHLEAGQIEFRTEADADGRVRVEIESWARSAGLLTDLLYHHVHMSKEIQLHMWVSFLEGVVSVAGGRMTGGVDIDTRTVDGAYA